MTTTNAGEEDSVVVERDGPVATVILSRPDKLNALNREMWTGPNEMFSKLNLVDSIRCLFLRGTDDNAMGPGADISEFESYRKNSEQGVEYGALMHGTLAAIRKSRHPVVAIIKELCVGGAMELSLMCDIRICGESSRFGVPTNQLGLVMAYPETAALIDLVGTSVAWKSCMKQAYSMHPKPRKKG